MHEEENLQANLESAAVSWAWTTARSACAEFGGEVLRPDGLLGIVLPSFVLLVEKLANEFLGALGDTRERGALRAGGV